MRLVQHRMPLHTPTLLHTAAPQVHMLDVQYRMHPLIAHFPSWRFYRAELQTGISPEDREHGFGGIRHPLCFANVTGPETTAGLSKMNVAEAQCVAELLRTLEVSVEDVGIVTPYAAQVQAIRGCLTRVIGEQAHAVQIASVDAFQGSESEVIILSMVRSNLQVLVCRGGGGCRPCACPGGRAHLTRSQGRGGGCRGVGGGVRSPSAAVVIGLPGAGAPGTSLPPPAGGGWFVAVGGWWRLAVGGGWRLVAVGGWRLVAVGVGRWAVLGGGPWGLSLTENTWCS